MEDAFDYREETNGQNDQEIENDEDQCERNEGQERTRPPPSTTEQLSHYDRLHDHIHSFSTGLAGC